MVIFINIEVIVTFNEGLLYMYWSTLSSLTSVVSYSSLVYQWTLQLESRSALKRSVDFVLCAMCVIKPMLFPMLLQKMGALVPIVATGHSASISDDRYVNHIKQLDFL